MMTTPPLTLAGLAEKYLRNRPDETRMIVTKVVDGVPLVGTYEMLPSARWVFLGGVEVFGMPTTGRNVYLYPDQVAQHPDAATFIFTFEEPTR